MIDWEGRKKLNTYEVACSYLDAQGEWRDYGVYTWYAPTASAARKEVTKHLRASCTRPAMVKRVTLVRRANEKES
jgi:hypothetical protein